MASSSVAVFIAARIVSSSSSICSPHKGEKQLQVTRVMSWWWLLDEGAMTRVESSSNMSGKLYSLN